MKVSEAIAAAVAAESRTAFGLMGDGNIPLWGPMVKAGIEMFSARNEAAAVSMADGYARVTGTVGICTITWGPGLTQIGTSLVAAARNRTPMVLLVPEPPAGFKNNLQTFDHQRFVESCETKYLRLSKPDNLAEEVAEAFYLARTTSSPVMLGMYVDMLDKKLEWDLEYQPSSDFVPAPQAASQAEIEKVVDELLAAERPVIVAGRGAKISGARDAIVQAADRAGALLATSLQAKGLFQGHAYDIGIAGSFASRPTEELFAQADYVLGFGAELGYYTSEGGLLFPSAKVTRIDHLAATPGIGIVPGRYVRGDAKLSAQEIAASLERRKSQREGFRNAETRKTLAAPAHVFDKPTDGLDPRQLMRELSKALPRGAKVTCGVGHYFGFVGMYLALPEGGDIQFSSQFGAVGQALGIALGMSCADRSQPRIFIEGDGSLLFHIQELDTVSRYKLPMVLVLLNDAGYGAEVWKLKTQGHDPQLARWHAVDYVAIAKAFGGNGVLLEKEADLPAAVARGLKQGGLFLIDCRISPTTLSDPYLKIHQGSENRAPLLRRPS